MNIVTIAVAILAVAGLVWAYPRTPVPWNYVILAIVVILCLVVLANLAGVPLRVS